VRSPTRRLLAPALVGVLAVAGCSLTLPPGVTDQSRDISALYRLMFVIAVVIFVVVEGLIVYSVIRFRRRPGDNELPPQIHGNTLVEAVWTVIPLAIVLGLFVASWQTLNRVEARSDTPPVTIDVLAFQFDWQFDYRDAGVSVIGMPDQHAEMVVPVGEPIRINLRSADVIHAFYVPAFNFKLDAVPGRVNSFEFTVREPGVYRGQCAEFCGLYHSRMLLTVRAVPRAEFDAWLASKAAPAAASSAPATASPSAPGGASPAASPAGGGTAEPIRIAANNIAFDQAELRVPADQPFALVFENQEPVPHNVAIYTDASASQPLFVGEIFAGPAERTYSVPALPAGSYFFRCDVHPVQMTGTLIAA